MSLWAGVSWSGMASARILREVRPGSFTGWWWGSRRASRSLQAPLRLRLRTGTTSLLWHSIDQGRSHGQLRFQGWDKRPPPSQWKELQCHMAKSGDGGGVENYGHFCNQLHQVKTERISRSQPNRRELQSACKDPMAERSLNPCRKSRKPERQCAEWEDELYQRRLGRREEPQTAEPLHTVMLRIWTFLQANGLSTRGTWSEFIHIYI